MVEMATTPALEFDARVAQISDDFLRQSAKFAKKFVRAAQLDGKKAELVEGIIVTRCSEVITEAHLADQPEPPIDCDRAFQLIKEAACGKDIGVTLSVSLQVHIADCERCLTIASAV